MVITRDKQFLIKLLLFLGLYYLLTECFWYQIIQQFVTEVCISSQQPRMRTRRGQF